MRLHIVLALAAVAGLTACAKAAAPTPKTDDEKALYSLGVAAGRDFQPFPFSEQELGLVYKTVKAGTGDSPKASDTVKVHYEGRFVDGKVFDSSLKRGEPITFPLGGVIPCWTEGVQLMKVGGKAQLVCPPELAYGDEGRPPTMRGGATLVFDVELLEIVKPEAVDAPAAAAPPATK